MAVDWLALDSIYGQQGYGVSNAFAGDTVYAESEVIDKRESKSRPNHGIVSVRTSGRKADGTVFISFERSMLIPMRGHAVDDRMDY